MVLLNCHKCSADIYTKHPVLDLLEKSFVVGSVLNFPRKHKKNSLTNMHGLGLKCQPFHRFSSRVKEICLDEKISNN